MKNSKNVLLSKFDAGGPKKALISFARPNMLIISQATGWGKAALYPVHILYTLTKAGALKYFFILIHYSTSFQYNYYEAQSCQSHARHHCIERSWFPRPIDFLSACSMHVATKGAVRG